jgi:hypothetical protein
MAAASGIPYSTLRRKVRGVGDFTLPELLAIAEACEVSPAVFFAAATPREMTSAGAA